MTASVPTSSAKPVQASAQHLTLCVRETRWLCPGVRLLRLGATPGESPQSAPGNTLPGFTAGAHVKVQVQLPGGATDWRAYSLINLSPLPAATAAPTDYLIAVRLDEAGRGGSHFMHLGVQVGDRLTVQSPRNDFALDPACAVPGTAVLLAGGIGVTPLAAMAAQRRAEGAPVRLHYAGRSRALLALLPELQALLGGDLRLHADDEARQTLDIGAVLDGCGPQDGLWVCGPLAMIDAVLAMAANRGWPPGRVRFELFAAAGPAEGDQAFELVLARSGRRLTVPADRSILAVLIAAGCDPLYDCERGDCGVCVADVIEGEPEHRDHSLTSTEKSRGKLIQTCVSRCKGPRLVLDL